MPGGGSAVIGGSCAHWGKRSPGTQSPFALPLLSARGKREPMFWGLKRGNDSERRQLRGRGWPGKGEYWELEGKGRKKDDG